MHCCHLIPSSPSEVSTVDLLLEKICSFKELLDHEGQIRAVKDLPSQPYSFRGSTEAQLVPLSQRHLSWCSDPAKNHLPYPTWTTIGTANVVVQQSSPFSSAFCRISYPGNPESSLLLMIYKAGKTQLHFPSTASACNAGHCETDSSWQSLQSMTR